MGSGKEEGSRPFIGTKAHVRSHSNKGSTPFLWRGGKTIFQ